MSAQQIARTLMERGITNFAEEIEEAEREAERREAEQADEEEVADDEPDPVGPAEPGGFGSEADNPCGEGRPKTNGPSSAAIVSQLADEGPTRKPNRPKFDPKKMILVEGTEHLRARVLATEFDDTVTVILRCSRWREDDDWKVLEIVGIEEDPNSVIKRRRGRASA